MDALFLPLLRCNWSCGNYISLHIKCVLPLNKAGNIIASLGEWRKRHKCVLQFYCLCSVRFFVIIIKVGGEKISNLFLISDELFSFVAWLLFIHQWYAFKNGFGTKEIKLIFKDVQLASEHSFLFSKKYVYLFWFEEWIDIYMFPEVPRPSFCFVLMEYFHWG